MPWWAFLLYCLPLVLLVGVIGLFAANAGASDVWTLDFPLLAAAALLATSLIWATNRSRKLQVRADRLQMSRRPIRFAEIESARYVDHQEAKRLQGSMRYSPLRPTSWGNRKRQYGAWWQPWMKGGIFLHLKPESAVITHDWIIGTRHPQELLELIQAGIDQAPKAAADPADTPSPVA